MAFNPDDPCGLYDRVRSGPLCGERQVVPNLISPAVNQATQSLLPLVTTHIA